MRLVSQTTNKILPNVTNKREKENIIYIRVSSRKQSEDLKRQQDYLVDKFPGYRVVSDIGSGINFKRKGFLSILEQVKNGNVQQVVVATRDRLCRFGFELVEWFFETFDTKLLVLQSDNNEEDTLSQDVLSIIQVFNCRNNGRRRYKSNSLQKSKDDNQSSTQKDII
jgi:predicted site-specific integrase-resolvase